MIELKKTVGIMGVSGDPVHAGHVAAAKEALRLSGMDEVLLMVTPHSPFKDPKKYAPIEHRTHLANLAAMSTGKLGSKIKVSDFEVLLHRFDVKNSTVVMLEHFCETYEYLNPVWLMGADNLASLHTWGDRWRDIMEKYPVGVFSRPGANDEALGSIAAKEYEKSFRSEELFACEPGTWTFIKGLDYQASTTEIRAKLARGEYADELCPNAIAYIIRHNLYGYNDALS